MKKTKNFLDSLDTIRNTGIGNRSDSSNSIINMKNAICDELVAYESFIPDFFSQNGAAAQIRSIYNALVNDIDYCTESVIYCTDMNVADKLYQEYHDGMYEFVQDLVNASSNFTESVDMTQYAENVRKASDKDHSFVMSIFNGDLNKAEDTTLAEAVKNIESLIEFIPQIRDLRMKCQTISESVKANNVENDELVQESIKLLYESVSNYCCESIKNIVNIYSDINDKINHVNETATKSVNEFSLF